MKFYDIHCHAFNLSHPSLLAFIKRINLQKYLLLDDFLPWIATAAINKKLNTITNLLSVMDNDLGDYFLLMEKDLSCFLVNGQLQIGGNSYDKVVLTPLMMDFGSKDQARFPNIHFNVPPKKPICDQVTDLFNGIRLYKKKSQHQLFEIYPFLGLNTNNYEWDANGSEEGLKYILDKYFGNYSCGQLNIREQGLSANMGSFDGDIDTLGNYSFAGVKVYPPLGFDPWPSDNRTIVQNLYQYCVNKCIPITTHCSDGGFVTDDHAQEFTSPDKWEQVLKKYPALKLNIAHFGKQSKKKYLFFSKSAWHKKVLSLILNYANVYADFACNGFGDDYYSSLTKSINSYSGPERDKIISRILFGTDFMINLLWIDSYKEYYKVFSGTGFFDPALKNQFTSVNPERFLFG